MEVEKLVKFSADYCADYLSTVIDTLSHPTRRFSLDSESSDTSLPRHRGAELNAKLLSFVALSICIGSVIFSASEGRDFGNRFGDEVILVFLEVIWLWILFALFAHVLCRIFHGRGTFKETLSVVFQLFSICYVICGFVVFSASLLVKGFFPGTALTDVVYSLYLVSQLVFLIVYIPPALKRVHHYSLRTQVILSIILPATVFATNYMLLYKVLDPIVRIHK